MRKPQKSPACSSRTSAWKSETAPDFRHRQTASLLTERKRLRGWPESCCSERASVRREHEAERCSSSSESLRLKRSCHGQTSGLRSETQATAFLFHQRTIGRSLTSFYWNVSFHLLKIYIFLLMTRTACGRSDFCSVRRCRLTAPSPPPTPEKAWLLALTLSALILIHVQILMLIKVQAHIQIRIKVLIQIKYSQVHKYLDTDNCFWFCASTQYILNETAQMQSFSFNSVGWTKRLVPHILIQSMFNTIPSFPHRFNKW